MSGLAQTSDGSTQEFLVLIERYAEVIRKHGKRARATTSDGSLFEALKPEEKRAAVFRIKHELELFDTLMGEGFALTDSPRLLWRYMNKLGLVPCSDVFDKIGDGDIAVIYDTAHCQLFQNLNWFHNVSVTIEQAFCTPWHLYTTRESWAIDLLNAAGMKIFTGEAKETFDPQVPEHVVREINTELLIQFRLKINWISPVHSQGKVAGVIAVGTMTPIE